MKFLAIYTKFRFAIRENDIEFVNNSWTNVWNHVKNEILTFYLVVGIVSCNR